MKKNILLSAAIFISIVLVAQEQSTKEQMVVQQTVIKLFDALSNSDTAGLKLYGTVDIKFYEYGQIWTIDTLIQGMMVISKAADYKRANKFDFVHTAIHGNTAWATYYLQSQITRNGKQELVKWMETVVLIKQKGHWKIKLLHSTLIKRT